jgi:hypothetical protein
MRGRSGSETEFPSARCRSAWRERARQACGSGAALLLASAASLSFAQRLPAQPKTWASASGHVTFERAPGDFSPDGAELWILPLDALRFDRYATPR